MSGSTPAADLGSTPSPDLGHARLDLDRSRRINLPEAVFCSGKTVDQCVEIVQRFLADSNDAVIATRATPEQAEALTALGPMAHSDGTFTWRHRPSTGFRVALAAAGTSDLPVADECRLTLAALGHDTVLSTDIGVAGLHRLIDALPELTEPELIIAFAGMEGALPTVLAGLVSQPIIAVPTSVGYGASFDGATALLGMMASCSPGITVVGIDNGYGAACAAHRIAGPSARP